jgi:hypothetical protein
MYQWSTPKHLYPSDPIHQGCDFDYLPGEPDFVLTEGNHSKSPPGQ